MAYSRHQLFDEIDRQIRKTPRKSLYSLARELGVHRKTIRNVTWEFKAKSFHEYQKELLLQRAIDLILDERGNLSLKQIAFTLGYRSPAAFSRFIKVETGRSPSEIRRLELIRKD